MTKEQDEERRQQRTCRPAVQQSCCCRWLPPDLWTHSWLQRALPDTPDSCLVHCTRVQSLHLY